MPHTIPITILHKILNWLGHSLQSWWNKWSNTARSSSRHQDMSNPMGQYWGLVCTGIQGYPTLFVYCAQIINVAILAYRIAVFIGGQQI